MSTANQRLRTTKANVLADLIRAALVWIWCIIRLPLLVVLAFLEPPVRVMLSGVAVLSVLTGLVNEGSSRPPPIPFWIMLCISIACLLLIPIYHSFLRLLSK